MSCLEGRKTIALNVDSLFYRDELRCLGISSGASSRVAAVRPLGGLTPFRRFEKQGDRNKPSELGFKQRFFASVCSLSALLLIRDGQTLGVFLSGTRVDDTAVSELGNIVWNLFTAANQSSCPDEIAM